MFWAKRLLIIGQCKLFLHILIGITHSKTHNLSPHFYKPKFNRTLSTLLIPHESPKISHTKRLVLFFFSFVLLVCVIIIIDLWVLILLFEINLISIKLYFWWLNFIIFRFCKFYNLGFLIIENNDFRVFMNNWFRTFIVIIFWKFGDYNYWLV